MRRIAIVFILVTAGSYLSCSKSNNSIYGTWKLTEFYIGTGSGAGWQPADRVSPQRIYFNSDGTVNGNFLTSATRFELTDATHLRVTGNNANQQARIFLYELESNGGLLLIPSIPACVDGCGYLFTRDK